MAAGSVALQGPWEIIRIQMSNILTSLFLLYIAAGSAALQGPWEIIKSQMFNILIS